MAVDDSFRKPGAVPFKWEIRPGVPKIQQQPPLQKQKQPPPPLPSPSPSPPFNHRRSSPSSLHINHHRLSSPVQPQKLKPPPAGSYFPPPPEPRTRSFRSTPRSRSERWRFDQPTRVRPECVSPGCFPGPLFGRKGSKRRVHVPRPESEPDYTSDLETLARWSVSSRKSLSPFRSPSSSYSSSYLSSPRPVSDSDWAGFGLF